MQGSSTSGCPTQAQSGSLVDGRAPLATFMTASHMPTAAPLSPATVTYKGNVHAARHKWLHTRQPKCSTAIPPLQDTRATHPQHLHPDILQVVTAQMLHYCCTKAGQPKQVSVNLCTSSPPSLTPQLCSSLASLRVSSPSSVLPVPGGPQSSTPEGTLALRAEYLSESRRQATTSRSSWQATSTPAMSLKVTTGAAVLSLPLFLFLHDPSSCARSRVQLP